ncbi:MAG: OmpA family, partial [Pseudomonadota bacterium]
MGTLFVTRKELAEGLKLPSNQRTRIVLVPKAICASLMGAAFDSNKTFLLPQCIPGLRLVHELLVERPQAELLVVAHTDASGEPAVNDPLSLARAEMAQAWFKDDVDAWLANYDAGVPKSQRWGVREDNLMVRHMPGFDQRERGASDRGTRTEDPISWFQRTRRLKVDGIAGRQTRRALVTEYFALARPSPSGNDDTEASAEAPDPPSVAVTAHGAGENYPLSVIQPILDARKKKSSFTAAGRTPAPVEDDDEPLDRRVEFFVFSKETGIEPAPGAPDGPEYLQWVTDATLRREVIVEDTRLRLPVVEFADVLF